MKFFVDSEGLHEKVLPKVVRAIRFLPMIYLEVFVMHDSFTWGAGLRAEVIMNIHLSVLVLDK